MKYLQSINIILTVHEQALLSPIFRIYVYSVFANKHKQEII